VTDWISQAECVGLGHLFFLEPGESSAPAKAICNVCPVRAECLADSLTHPEPWHGIFGGMSVRERRRLASTMDRPKPVRIVQHGTTAGYEQERRLGVGTCDRCREAHAADIRERNERRRLGKVAS
jgi:WhiB family redox-sensing transcriptional regulator